VKRDLGWWILTSIAGFIGFCAFQANADVTVTDDGFSLSPNPANIVVGEIVYWRDDGTGPYQIISDTGAWQTFNTPGAILFNQTGIYSYHDDAGNFGTVSVSPNIPPSVTITNPATNAVLTAPATFVFGADASDSDSDGLLDVEFYVGTNLVDDVFSSPFTTTVTNLTAGTYSLTVIAYDNGGATATNSITIYVQNILLTAPRLAAGQFQFDASGLTGGKTNVLQTSTNLGSTANWVSLATNVATTNLMSFTNSATTGRHFFRLVQLP
jgi:Big-like domain-containing protein